MENVSKALIIAGGILITIMVLSLIIVLWNQMSGYFTEQHNATIIEQSAEFNAQFENYNGKSIRGNELISVMNKVVDYNRSDYDLEGYDKIIIEVDLKRHQNHFKYDFSDSNIFSEALTGSKISNESGDTNIEKISNLSTELVNNSHISGLTDTKLQKLSASIAVILDDNNSEYRNQTLKNILGYEVIAINQMNNIKNVTKQYYQYTQFKRAMFKCTGIDHNTENGRVNKIIFEIEEDANGNVKFN